MSKKVVKIRISEEDIYYGWSWFIFFPAKTEHVCSSNRYYSSKSGCLRSAKNFCKQLSFKFVVEKKENNMIKIRSAKNAKKLSDKNKEEVPSRVFQEELEQINKYIEKQIFDGHTKCSCISPSFQAREYLEKLGYKVEKSEQWNSHTWYISWEY